MKFGGVYQYGCLRRRRSYMSRSHVSVVCDVLYFVFLCVEVIANEQNDLTACWLGLICQ